MTRLTRRGALGLGAAGMAAACATATEGDPATFPGKVEFRHGVASGDPMQTRVVIWTRVTTDIAGPVPVRWTIAREPNLKGIVKRGVATTGPERDFTVKVDVDGLRPGETYYYWFTVGRVASIAGRTKTLPSGGTADYKMAVVSCTNWPFGYFNAYREISKRTDLDAVIHLGDYIYEYGTNGYGGAVGQQLGRNHEPATECVKLDDYRMRHAQYKADPDSQAAHAIAPWFCTWDDHESANNSYRTGAENHQTQTEGSWTDRKAQAVQAYLEWMPVRDPVPGKPREAIWHKVDIGDLATLFLLEGRLVGRGEDLNFDSVFMAPEADKKAAADALHARVNDPNRSLLGPEQEAWLAQELKASVDSGKKWQVLGNQVTMARVKSPDLEKLLDSNKFARVPQGSRRFYTSSRHGFEWNLDAWSGFPAARDRLYAAARAAKARIVTLTGDTHTAWANELHDKQGYRIGVEFGCTSVTSNGAGDSIPLEDLNWLMAEANDEVIYYNAFSKGFTLLTLKAGQVEAEYVKVSTIRTRAYVASTDAHFIARPDETGALGALERRMSAGATVTRG